MALPVVGTSDYLVKRRLALRYQLVRMSLLIAYDADTSRTKAYRGRRGIQVVDRRVERPNLDGTNAL